MQRISDIQAKFGARLNSLDAADEINANFNLHNQSLISSIQDLEYAEAITNSTSKA